MNGLGSSEATNLYLSDRAGAARPGTVGWVVPGFQVAVVGPGDGERADEGELLVRGASVMSGYLGEPEASARALADGWLHTGDLVRRQRDGSHTFLGRLGQRLKVGGFWVDPLRVEEVLVADGAVREAAAVGAEDREGLPIVALVVTEEQARAGARRTPARGCRQDLAAHEAPRAVIPCRLPTCATGKVDRMAPAELARAFLDRGGRTGRHERDRGPDGAPGTLERCGYYRLVGMRVKRADAEGSEFALTVSAEHLQAYGTAHGGVIAGLLDAAMGLAILGRVPDGEAARPSR